MCLSPTTVVEVGVDVPNATVMVVLDADRFGISQLHQLRGRIGRGSAPGLGLLVSGMPQGTPAYERLDAVASTSTGSSSPALDLEQRREGDVLGAAQSGPRPPFGCSGSCATRTSSCQARQEASAVVDADPDAGRAPGAGPCDRRAGGRRPGGVPRARLTFSAPSATLGGCARTRARSRRSGARHSNEPAGHVGSGLRESLEDDEGVVTQPTCGERPRGPRDLALGLRVGRVGEHDVERPDLLPGPACRGNAGRCPRPLGLLPGPAW